MSDDDMDAEMEKRIFDMKDIDKMQNFVDNQVLTDIKLNNDKMQSKNEKLNLQTLHALQQKSEIWKGDDEKKWLILFSKSGFTEDVLAEAEKNKNILTVDLAELMR